VPSNGYLLVKLGSENVHFTESAIREKTAAPFWEAMESLPPATLSVRGLCENDLKFTLKHAHDPKCLGPHDPIMAMFDVDIGPLMANIPGDQICSFSQMVHSDRNYPYSFSARITGEIQLRNVPDLCQLREGCYTTKDGVIDGRPLLPYKSNLALSTTTAAATTGVAPHSVSVYNTPNKTHPHHFSEVTSPSAIGSMRGGGGGDVSKSNYKVLVNNTPPPEVHPHHHANTSRTLSPSKSRHKNSSYFQGPTPAPAPVSSVYAASPLPPPLPPLPAPVPSLSIPAPGPTIHGPQDIDLYDSAHAHTRQLVQNINQRLTEIKHRKREIVHLLADKRTQEQHELEQSARRRATLLSESDDCTMQLTATEVALKAVRERMQSQRILMDNQLLGRRKAREQLCEEEASLADLEGRVMSLREDMARHAAEEEVLYARRVDSASQAVRRADDDNSHLRSIEARLRVAEDRAVRRREEGETALTRLRGSHRAGSPAMLTSPTHLTTSSSIRHVTVVSPPRTRSHISSSSHLCVSPPGASRLTSPSRRR